MDYHDFLQARAAQALGAISLLCHGTPWRPAVP
jgi:hypothetical protein